MGTRVHYPEELKLKAIEMKLNGKFANQQIMDQLGIKNKAQIKTWMRWYRSDQMHRLSQPVGKQYAYGKGPDGLSKEELLKRENKQLKVQLSI